MKVSTATVVGLGKVGNATAIKLQRQGIKVYGVDVDPEKTKGHIYPAAQCFKCFIPKADMVVICVGTPGKDDGTLDYTALESAAETILPLLKEGSLVVIRSTTAPGTIERVFAQYDPSLLACAPEFAREDDLLSPSTFGAYGGPEEHFETLRELFYHPACQFVWGTDTIETAEAIKLALNAWHALKLTYFNELDRAATRDTTRILRNMVVNEYPFRYLEPGRPYAGACLPKDVRALGAWLGNEGILTKAIDASNTAQEEWCWT